MRDMSQARAAAKQAGDIDHDSMLRKLTDRELGTLLRELRDVDAHRATTFHVHVMEEGCGPKSRMVSPVLTQLYAAAKMVWETRIIAKPLDMDKVPTEWYTDARGKSVYSSKPEPDPTKHFVAPDLPPPRYARTTDTSCYAQPRGLRECSAAGWHDEPEHVAAKTARKALRIKNDQMVRKLRALLKGESNGI